MNDLPSQVNAELGEKRQECILTIWKCKALGWTLNFSFLDISMMALMWEEKKTNKNYFYCTLETEFVFMELYLIPAEMNLRSCLI